MIERKFEESAFRSIINKILSGKIKGRNDLDGEKKRLSSELKLDKFIRNSEILRFAKNKKEREKLLRILQKKPTRTISGVAIVAAMVRPYPCPHGKCNYCPGGPDINVPQSYTGKEPATRRAIRYGFDPYLQVSYRLKQLKEIGHSIDKVEMIIMGGTLTYQPLSYQKYFVKGCLSAMNDFSRNWKKKKIKTKKLFKNLKAIQKENESSSVRCIGMTFEPRPDWAKEKQINNMLSFGVTRVELGVQMPFDRVYKRVGRGHSVKDVVVATQELKDSALKVGYHMMPGILGKDEDLDLKGFRKILTNQNFRPDMIKIYPCLVMEGTDHYENWRKGKFTPLETNDAIKEIIKIKKMLPPWIRTMRIQRDIPSPLVSAGVKSSNLGEMVYNKMQERKIKCNCIRCREVGRKISKENLVPEIDNIKLLKRKYKASGGEEVFLSFEDTKQDILIGFLRLRIPNNPFRKEIANKTSLIRELHIYGPMVEIGEKPKEKWQHRGYGKELIEEAEIISKERYDMNDILVISGIGAKNYYKKFCYKKVGPYMGKTLH